MNGESPNPARHEAKHAARGRAARPPADGAMRLAGNEALRARGKGGKRDAGLPRHARRSAAREITEWIITLALAVALALSVNTWVGGLITVKGQSMEPTLLDDDRVLIGKLEYRLSGPKRGDIVIVRYPNRSENIIKRVIATAGERVAVSAGSVYINGRKLDEPYIFEPMTEDYPETTVPEGTIFVMGDNRNYSLDSRDSSVGPVPLTKVLGKVYLLAWPPGRWEKLTRYAGTLAAP